MGRPIQVLAMPHSGVLTDTGSPWRVGSEVRIPYDVWQRLQTALRAPWPETARQMGAWSREDADDDRLDLDRGALQVVIADLEAFMRLHPGAIALQPTEPGSRHTDYSPTEYQRIVGDILEVLKASRDTGEPFSAWLE